MMVLSQSLKDVGAVLDRFGAKNKALKSAAAEAYIKPTRDDLRGVAVPEAASDSE